MSHVCGGVPESFNGKMRDELLAREIFYSLKEAQILIEAWRMHYNHFRPHSALAYQPPAPVAILDPLSAQSLTLTLVQ
jgi:putative transposase